MVEVTQDEIQAVARAIEDQLTAEEGWMVGTPAIKRMCEDFAQAAIAALDAARGKAEPVAWMYTHGDGIVGCTTTRYEPAVLNALGYTETPLYAHPPADRVAQVVEWLRKRARNDIESAKCCRMGNAGQTLRRFAQRRLMDADAIERGEPFNG